MLQLIIEPVGMRPRTVVSVDETTVVGIFVASLVERFAYPKVDAAGRPISYHLRLASSNNILPHALQMRETRIASGTRLVLELEGATYATVPMAVLDAPDSCVKKSGWNRRSLLFAGAGLAVLGAGSGFSTVVALHSLFGHSRAVIVGHSGTFDHTPSTAPLHGATARLTFSGHQQTVRVVGWSPDGALLASGADDTQLLIWSPDGMIQQRIPHPASVQTLAWSPESQRLVSGSANLVTFFMLLTGGLLSRSAHQAPVTSVAWTPNNAMQVVSGAMDTHAIVWDTTHYQPQSAFLKHDTPIDAVSWGADGQTVASASQGGAVRVWNAETTREIHGFYQDAHKPMRACAFAPVEATLAIGGDDGVIRLWNGLVCQQQQEAGNEGLMCQDTPQRLSTSPQPIRSLAWSPDGYYLASGSDDGSFCVWSVAQGRPTTLFSVMVQPGIAVHSIVWSPDGKQLALASGNAVMLWGLF